MKALLIVAMIILIIWVCSCIAGKPYDPSEYDEDGKHIDVDKRDWFI